MHFFRMTTFSRQLSLALFFVLKNQSYYKKMKNKKRKEKYYEKYTTNFQTEFCKWSID